MDALRQMGRAATRVRRGGHILTIADEELVPGDIVLLEAGDVVTADLRLVDCNHMQCDESMLTGESVPVDKEAISNTGAPQDLKTATAWKGTFVTRGSCVGLVIATGIKTELGQIAEVTDTAEGATSPLERRLQKLSEHLLLAVLALILILTISGVLAGRDIMLMVKTSIALAVAAIPEGLPIVATLALARGMSKLAARNALIERLSAVETLGSVTVIITDKTGTLTENKMTVTTLATPDRPDENNLEKPEAYGVRALRVCALCYSGDNADMLRDPMEKALVEAARTADMVPREMELAYPRIAEHAFDPAIRMMATVHRDGAGQYLYAIKGAPEAVLASVTCYNGAPIKPEIKQHWLDQMGNMARRGLRVLALADKLVPANSEAPFENLEFLGLVGLEDPPRADAAQAVRAAQAAGIRVVMATGDSMETGQSIAQAVGISAPDTMPVLTGEHVRQIAADGNAQPTAIFNTQVFARMSPGEKLTLIDFHQRNGAVVAMTGDGVNDAPALKKADVGIAMGERGTEVAKQAADMILKDDSFSSIVVAIQQGRIIFANIRKFVIYLLSCNLSEILVVAAAILLGMPLPLLPLQILFLNLVTDVFPALALGFSSGDAEILQRPPRPKSEGLIGARHWQAIVAYAGLMAACVIAAFVWALGQENTGVAYANTVAFLSLALGQLWHVFNMRSRKALLLDNQIIRNKLVWAAIGLCLGLIAIALSWSLIRDVLQLQQLDAKGWAVVAAASLGPLIFGQAAKELNTKFRRARG
ncbi:cation-translocating P-type ATPase [Kordiimonas gwangyangensis]|nr:cation-transporting P-type ATPase [Kordiimonas gwangyangensis]